MTISISISIASASHENPFMKCKSTDKKKKNDISPLKKKFSEDCHTNVLKISYTLNFPVNSRFPLYVLHTYTAKKSLLNGAEN